MAADPLDIVSLARCKTALRLEGDDTAHDALLTSYIKGAADWAEELCQMGIVDRAELRTVESPADRTEPLSLTSRAPMLSDFRWRRANRPGASFASATVTGEVDGLNLFSVAAPAGGWPPGDLLVTFTRSMPAADVPGAIRSAMLLWVRDAYDMMPRIDVEDWPALVMLRPYQDLRAG